MLTKLTFAAVVLTTATTAFAHPLSALDKAVALQDGSTVYVFKDGRMAMQDRLGRAVSMQQGHVMKTRDGQSIAMVGDETARLDCFLRTQLGGGK
jgi:hypothetical protein